MKGYRGLPPTYLNPAVAAARKPHSGDAGMPSARHVVREAGCIGTGRSGILESMKGRTMVMIPPDCTPVRQLQEPAHVSRLEKILRLISVLTMLMTVPQVLAVWVAEDVGGVSLISWAAYLFSAVLWFIYGVQKRDKTIYLACVGWVLLDSAVVVGVVVHS